MLTKTIMLALMAVFYIAYFAKMFSQKRQGIDTDQLGKDKEGVHKYIELALKLTTYLTPAIQTASILYYKNKQARKPTISIVG